MVGANWRRRLASLSDFFGGVQGALLILRALRLSALKAQDQTSTSESSTDIQASLGNLGMALGMVG